ncbi:MAG: leucine/isoleucine/valine transporter permease subunit [Anaerolineales bacterium]|uniref:Leucine/isoleucine/valine transporter permease subunit n=1 Tax=Candidatus Desulfolinea nitratireducens TaxID=2841698 RepID=A0A8J6TIU8_9CHLR|nr:leucine/isoleucine/valine transporter permease subunit [Candidatus Desulfolinea nitratireducens]MBL6959573.1 leucine/isoleucine/valine transporter permease subunit [Anaerolineales bacterium]
MIKTLQENFQKIQKFALLGGIVAIYLVAVGMVETFAQRNLIGTSLSLGHAFLVLGPIGVGILIAQAMKESETKSIYVAGFLAGALSSVSLILFNIVIQIFVIQADPDAVFYLRNMFVSFTPTAFEFLTFGQGMVLGNILLFLFFGLMGMLGVSFLRFPDKIRRGWINSLIWVLAVGLFSENVAQILRELFGPGLGKIIFSNKSMNPVAAIILFAVVFAFSYFGLKKEASDKWAAMPEEKQKKGRVFIIIMAILFVAILPWLVGLFLSQALFIIGMYVMMGLGLNIVVGYAGLLDLGYVAFFAFGAYTMGILTTTGALGRSDLNFWMALPFAMLIGVLWGLLLGFPVLRMRGDYLAIVTLGFGEIIRILALSNWLAPFGGGAQGILHIPQPEFFGLSMNSPQAMYYLVVLGAVLAAFVTIRLRDSRLGRQWMAMREDEDVAEAMGINLIQTKLLAFSIGAAFSALAGAIFAARLGNIFPHSFNILISINALALIIVGGLGSIPGVVVGAIILIGLPEMLREFAEYRLLMYGMLLIIMMIVKPDGFMPEARRSQELRDEKDTLPKQAAGTEG